MAVLNEHCLSVTFNFQSDKIAAKNNALLKRTNESGDMDKTQVNLVVLQLKMAKCQKTAFYSGASQIYNIEFAKSLNYVLKME